MIYENVLRFCKQKGMNISELEKETNISNGTIGRWRTSSPTVEKLGRVAKFFGCTIDELLKDPAPDAK